MKRIKYEKKLLTATGQPITIPHPDSSVIMEARDKAIAEGKTEWTMPTIPGEFGQVMTWFVDNIPHGLMRDGEGKVVSDHDGRPRRNERKLTPTDAGNAYAVIKAFRNVENGYVELEEAVYEWLVKLVATDGIEAFKPITTQAIVNERLSDLWKEGTKESKTNKE